MAYVDADEIADLIESFWRALAVDSNLLGQVSGVHLRWDGIRLLVNSNLQGTTDIVSRVHSTFFAFQKPRSCKTDWLSWRCFRRRGKSIT